MTDSTQMVGARDLWHALNTVGDDILDYMNQKHFRRVDPTWLCVFRILFGCMLLYQIEKMKGPDYKNLHFNYYQPKFLFPYPGFEFVKLVDWESMVQFTDLAWYAALAVIMGMFYYPAMICVTGYYSYVFLLDKSLFLNHNYLIILVSFIMCIAPANCSLSMDSILFPLWRKKRIPAIYYIFFCSLMTCVYFFASIWKLNHDWLSGEPLRHWLTMQYSTDRPPAWFIEFARQWWVPYLFSYGGIFIDLLASFVYCQRPSYHYKKFYYVASILHIAFHVINHYTMGIGIFPWLCIAMYGFTACPCIYRHLVGQPQICDKPPKEFISSGNWVLLIVYVFFIGLMVTIPSRIPEQSRWREAPGHAKVTKMFLENEDVMWTEYGFDFTWRMKLRDKECKGKVLVQLNANDTWHEYDPVKNEHIHPGQYSRMLKTPYMARQYAVWLADEMEKFPGLKERPKITMDTICSMNYRPPQNLFKKGLDLADKNLNTTTSGWIEPLKPFDDWKKYYVFDLASSWWNFHFSGSLNMTEMQEKWLKRIEL